MKRTAVDGSNKNPNMSGLLIFLLVIASAISSGCIDKQERVKIDLGRTEEGVVRVLENDTDVVYFGFDLRPGPKGKHAGNLTDWDKTEMPCGFVEADDSGYAEMRGLATRYGMVEQGVVE